MRFAPVLGLLAVVCLVGGTVSAAGPPASGACATGRKVLPRGSVTYADQQFPATLNPDQTLQSIARLTNELQNDSLVRYDARGHLYPLMLARVPSRANGGISADGRTIRLYLKQGLHWSNGAAVTSHQIWFGWKVGMDPLSGPACLDTCDRIASIGLPNAYEAVLHLRSLYASAVPRALPDIVIESWKGPHGGWARDNAHQAAYALYQDPTFNFLGPDYPTTGPYQVTGVKPGKTITFRPNPHYSNMSCGADLASVTFRAFPSRSGLIAAAATRQTDITLDYHPADLRTLRASPGHYRVLDIPTFVYEHLELNLDRSFGGKPNPLANVKVRQAMALAIDKRAVVARALGLSGSDAARIVANNPWVRRPGLQQAFADASITGQWDPLVKGYVRAGSSRALKDARTLLAATVWKSGFSLQAVTTQLAVRRRTLDGVASDWSKLGIKLSISTQPDQTLFGTWEGNGTLSHGRFQVALFSWVGSPDPDSWTNELSSVFVDRRRAAHSDLNQNYAGIADAVIDSNLTLGSATYDTGHRTAAYHAVQRELNQRAYWIGLYYRDDVSTTDGRVKHFAPNPTTWGDTWNAYAWTT